MSATQNAKIINASREVIYNAFTDPRGLEKWFAPGDMTGKIHSFDLRPGGGYEMSLFYPKSKKEARGKTNAQEDRYYARFVELKPFEKIVQAINFDSSDEQFAGEMIMEVILEPKGAGTNVIIRFTNIPSGIKPEDNEAGTKLTLDKLARYIE